MTLRRKILLLVAVGVLAALLLTYGVSEIVFQRGFAAVERNDTRSQVARALSAVQSKLAQLDSQANDYAMWDDTYAFMASPSEQYIASNLVDSTFTTLGVNLILLQRPDGALLYGQGFDLGTQKKAPLPVGLEKDLTARSPLRELPSTKHGTNGIVMLPGGPWLVASRPILTSAGEGPSRGAVIMGRALDSAQIASLADQTHLSLAVQSIQDGQASADFQTAIASLSGGAPVFVHALSNTTVAGYALLKDIYGQPAVVVRIESPRAIYAQGRSSATYYALALLGIMLVFGLGMAGTLERSVLSRLSRLRSQVEKAGKREGDSLTIELKGNDEISALAGTVKSAFSALEASETQLAEHHAELEAAHGRLQRLQKITAALSSNLELEQVLERAGSEPLDLLESSSLWLLAVSPDGSLLEGRAVIARPGIDASFLPWLFQAASPTESFGLTGGESTLVRAAVSQVPEFIDNIQELESRACKNILGWVPTELAWVKGVALVPLVAEGKTTGLLILASDRSDCFPEDQRATTLVLAGQIAFSLSNMELYRQISRLSETDGATELYNYRMLHDLLRKEVARAERTKDPFSLLMADVDDFKLLNDTYGHPTGDDILRHVAGLLKDHARASDLVGRYGGDEFMIILPGQAHAGAVSAAAHLKTALGARPFITTDGFPVPVRLSFGVATFPMSAKDADGLVIAADADLYESKARGGGPDTVPDRLPRTGLAGAGMFNVLDGLVAAVDNKDRYTRRHSEQVTDYALGIAQALGLSRESQRSLRIAGLLHDVGKIGVPDRVLRKPGPLTKEERGAIRQHALLGEMIIQDVPSLKEVRAAVVSHHECYDGTGYPYGLAGSEIPLLGRILAVADAYSAMTTDRPYRKAISEEQAMGVLLANAGTCFDPDVVRVFAGEVLGVSGGQLKKIFAEANTGELSGLSLARWRQGL